MRRFTVTQTPVKDHRIMQFEKLNNNNNNNDKDTCKKGKRTEKP